MIEYYSRPDTLNFLEIIADRAGQNPDHPAIEDGDKQLTYKELIGRVGAAAARFAKLGIRPKDVVGLRLRDHGDHFVAILALGQLGAASVSLDWRSRPAETARLISSLGLAVVVVEPGDQSIDSAACYRASEIIRDGDDPVFSDGYTDSDDLPFKISLSSGTTGEPRGVAVTHRQYAHRWLMNYANMGPWDQHGRILTAMPICFIGGRNFPFFCLCSGKTLVIHPTLYSPEELVESIHRLNITSMLMGPTTVRALLDLAPEEGHLLSRLNPLTVGTAPLFGHEKHAIVRHLSPHFFENYSTSGTGNITRLLTTDLRTKADSVGRPSIILDARIVDDAGNTLPVGEPGLICVRGPSVPSDPETTFFGYSEADVAETLRDGWFYPGELGAFDQDGYLYIKGRATNVIIRGGANIYPEEVEKVLLALPEIKDAAVIGQPSPQLGETVAAFIVGGDDLDIDKIKRHCRQELSAYKVPESITVVANLPRTTSGKISKKDLLRRLA